MAMLEVRDLRKSFYTYAKPGLQAGIFHKPGARKVVSQLDVLKGVDLTVNKGDVVAILGPSGSGKTTFLRCLNFLETTDSGTLIFDGEQFDLGKITKADIARLRKKTAFVFQNYNLFRNKTALQNVTEGLVIARKMPKAQADAIGMKMLEKVGLADRADSYPRQLSGGQQQRVAFARALVMGQEILLLDEPLSNLDAKLRVEVRTELRQIQQKFGITTMYVTHDQDEALSMSDIIAVMRRGRIEQIGSPWEIYFRPATRFVADFVGTVNFLEGTAHREADGSLSVDHRGMRLRVDEDTDLQGGEPVTLVVRPEGISLMGLEETVPEGTALRGTIENYSFLGRMIRYWVRVGEEVFVIDDANVDLTGARTGDVQLRLDTRKLHVLKGGGADAAG